ncbi:WhiB family transcriptional regulator [Pseudonocardiaceae bacterium YIM PH 21723]|nr:WhiB family transcriptional regulator [Pseudonocardiaceae bacterium YIM PH 21723]
MTDWRHRAACKTTDPELFFPVSEVGPSTCQITEAKTFCNGGSEQLPCPVRTDCLEWAMAHGADAGVWGGLTEDERRSLRRSRARRSKQAGEVRAS